MINLHPLDSTLIILYFVITFVIGWRAAKRGKGTTEDFLLAGRTLTLPMFVATLVSTWYGGILGIGEFAYRFGLSNWIVFGLPYYFFGLVFALFLAKKVRSTNLVTMPDKLESTYDRKTSVLGSSLLFILATPAPYALMLGFLTQIIFGLQFLPSVIIATIISIGYLHFGGFRSNLWTNIYQFLLMFLGFIIMLYFSAKTFGGLNYISENVPPKHLTWHGGNTFQYIIVWFFIALWTLVDPSFHQRCYAAKNGKTAQQGILVSIMFWFIFDFLTTSTGLYARAALPNLTQPVLSYPYLAEVALPIGAKAFFYIALLATIMSTLSSLTLISGITFGKDIVSRIKNISDETAITRWTRIGILIAAVISISLAVLLPSVVRIWYTIGTAIIPGLIIPVVASYYPRLKISACMTFSIMLSGWLVSTGWLVYGNIIGEYPLGVEPMYPGLLVGIILWVIGKVSE